METKSISDAMKAAAEELLRLKASNGWQILMTQCQSEKSSALDDLAEVDPDDVRAIRKLQNEVWRCNWLESTIDEMIRQGLDHELLVEHIEDDKEEPHE